MFLQTLRFPLLNIYSIIKLTNTYITDLYNFIIDNIYTCINRFLILTPGLPNTKKMNFLYLTTKCLKSAFSALYDTLKL